MNEYEKEELLRHEKATEEVTDLSIIKNEYYKEEHSHSLFPSSTDIRRLTKIDALKIHPHLKGDQIQPASIELRVGNEIWVSDATFPQITPQILKKHAEKIELGMKEEFECEVGKTYVIRSLEKIELPSYLEAISDTKSTVGRLGGNCQAASDKYSHLESGFPNTGRPENIYFTLEPNAFNLILKAGKTKLFQIRLRKVDTNYMTAFETESYYSKEVGFYDNGNLIPYENVREEDGLKITLNTEKVFAQKQNPEPIDLTKKNHYKPSDYWEEIKGNEEIVMDPNKLYLFGSNERLSFKNVAGWLTREGPYLGHGLSTHFAGFIDPGFDGKLTFEYWSFKKRILPNGQYSGRILLEELASKPEKLYGSKELGSSYQHQSAPRLPKVFKDF